jgi:hypothetical protein
MTIMISTKVKAGIVLACDSAITVTTQNNNTVQYAHVFNHAQKLFNLYNGLPIAIASAGAYNLGKEILPILYYEFGQLITSDDLEWKIDFKNYTVNEVAQKLKKFIFKLKYPADTSSFLGILVVGYSSNCNYPEMWSLTTEIENYGPVEYCVDSAGCKYFGDGYETLHRLEYGNSIETKDILLKHCEPKIVDAIIKDFEEKASICWVDHLMPIQDAIDLTRFLAETAVNSERFKPNVVKSVGGAIDIAIITRDKGFQWIQTKTPK